ncbi:class I SAM-dependent methyltransferase [Qipengyuania sp. RANM35]|uniref:class I SAM-dependent methyltransferase n=1 Tax=Qipengyuania sp. RANM35 TaxID=3068635 RepID=UPI0034DAE0E6
MTPRFLFAMAPVALVLSACATTAVDPTPAVDTAAIASAVAASDRPENARKMDEGRKPAEVLAFLGLEPGMVAADLFTATGYWAEIMGHVVGENGKVIAYQPDQFYNDDKSKAAWAELIARTPAVEMARHPFDAFAPPASSLDFAIVNDSYHDLYWTSEQYKIPFTDPKAYVRALYAGMKPGGIVGVIDHVGLPGDTRAVVDAVHRIDPAVVRADFEAAGFVLEAQSDVLANPEDDHTKLVFDPSVRGKTDRFVYRFRKPR